MAITAIVRRDLLRFVRNPVRTALLFAMPVVMAGIFALVFSGGGADNISIRILVWDEDESLLSQFLSGAGGSSEADERLELVPVGAEGYEMMDQGEASALVHLPKGFTRALLDGTPSTIEVVKNPAQRFLPQVVEEGATLGASVLSAAARVFRPELDLLRPMIDNDSFPEDVAVAAMSASVTNRLRDLEKFLFPPVIQLETATLSETDADETGNSISNILGFVLPGLSMMGILFIAQAATRDIVRERETGLLRHLLTAPVRPTDYVLGKCLSVLLITAIGFSILIGFGLVAGVSWGNPLAIAAMVIASSMAAAGALLLIMSLVGSERQGDALTTIVIITWSMVGGAFISIQQMPDFLLPISKTTPVYWAVEGFQRIMAEGAGVAQVGLNLLILTGCGVVFLAVGSWFLGRRVVAGAV